MPRDTKLRSTIKEKFCELVTQNNNSTKIEISSHWQKYLPGVKVYLEPKDGLPRKAFIQQQGLAGLEKIRLRSLIYNTVGIVKNNYLMIKFSVNFVLFLKIIKISIKTTRLLNFDMVKHAILISKTKKYLDISQFSNFMVIGDGFGFLGTFFKEISLQIKNIGGTLVSLNRNSKTHPDGSLINLENLVEKYTRTLIFEENPCQFYSQYPTGRLVPLFLPFDGPVHFKIIEL